MLGINTYVRYNIIVDKDMWQIGEPVLRDMGITVDKLVGGGQYTIETCKVEKIQENNPQNTGVIHGISLFIHRAMRIQRQN